MSSLETFAAGEAGGGLIVIKQLPIIEERLRTLSGEIGREVEDALSLACTDDTVRAVKKTRAELNRRFAELEEQRKAVKAAVLGPYEQFEAVYRECVSSPFQQADTELKGRIDAVEQEVRRQCEERLRDYFAELCAAERIDFLRFEQLGLKIGMAEARSKSANQLREQITSFVVKVSEDMSAISELEDAAEVMVEFKRTLDAARAIAAVQERRRQAEAEKAAQEAREAARAREAAAVEQVEAALPPPVVEPPAAEEARYRCTFTVRATREQLKKLKEFMMQEGISYE